MRPEDFLSILKDRGRDYSAFLLGTIAADYVSGRPSVQFDGEGSVSVKTYPYLSIYTPAANDRVLVAMVNHGGVILGKII